MQQNSNLTHLCPSEFVLCTFHIFPKMLYAYMVLCLQHQIDATDEGVLSAKQYMPKQTCH